MYNTMPSEVDLEVRQTIAHASKTVIISEKD